MSSVSKLSLYSCQRADVFRLDATAMVGAFEPLIKIRRPSRPKTSESSRRSSREQSVASDATVDEDLQPLVQRYSSDRAGLYDTEERKYEVSNPQESASSYNSRCPSPDHDIVPIRAARICPTECSSASQSFSSNYGRITRPSIAPHQPEAMQDDATQDLRRARIREFTTFQGPSAHSSFGPPEPQESLPMSQSRPLGPVMEWSQSPHAHFEPTSSYMLQLSRPELGNDGQPNFHPTGPQAPHNFHQNQSIEHDYLTPGLWQQQCLSEPNFTAFDGMSAMGSTLAAHPQPSQEGHYIRSTNLSGPQSIGLNTHHASVEQKPSDDMYTGNWVHQQSAMMPPHR